MNKRELFQFFSIGVLIVVGVMSFGFFIKMAITPPVPIAQSSDIESLVTPFSVVVLPDTQIYSQDFPDLFCQQTAWIVDRRQEQNIVFVTHLGDIVNNGGDATAEWEAALRCMNILDPFVPLGIVPGNHDVDNIGDPNPTFNTFNLHFPETKFTNREWYGGNFNRNQNSYQLISASSVNLLFLHLEVDPPDEVLQWASSILQSHPDRKAIVTTHVYLNDASGERSQAPHFRPTNSAEDIWHKLIAPNCNVFLVLSGHFHDADGENQLRSLNNCGRPVDQIVQDYQDREQGGNGRLRIYQFHPLLGKINVHTYSPVLEQYEVDQDSQFELEVELL